MAGARGFIVILNEVRMERFLSSYEERGSFAEPVAEFQHSRTIPLVCFITSNNAVTHIALGKRGMRAGTGLHRLNVTSIETLPHEIFLGLTLLKNTPSLRRSFDRIKNAYQ